MGLIARFYGISFPENGHGILQCADHESEFLSALRLFDPVWRMLTTHEQTRIIQLAIERISYNGQSGQLEIRFSPAGIHALAAETQE